MQDDIKKKKLKENFELSDVQIRDWLDRIQDNPLYERRTDKEYYTVMSEGVAFNNERTDSEISFMKKFFFL